MYAFQSKRKRKNKHQNGCLSMWSLLLLESNNFWIYLKNVEITAINRKLRCCFFLNSQRHQEAISHIISKGPQSVSILKHFQITHVLPEKKAKFMVYINGTKFFIALTWISEKKIRIKTHKVVYCMKPIYCYNMLIAKILKSKPPQYLYLLCYFVE